MQGEATQQSNKHVRDNRQQRKREERRKEGESEREAKRREGDKGGVLCCACRHYGTNQHKKHINKPLQLTCVDL